MPFIGNKPAQVPLTSADIADSIITSAKIVDGTIVNADINASAAIAGTKLSGAGKVLQVVSATKTDTQSFSTTTFTDVTDLSVSITPSSASNKILVLTNVNGGWENGVAKIGGRIMRDSTAIAIGDASGSRIRLTGSVYFGVNCQSPVSMGMNFLDSPNTTSATTYKFQVSRLDASGTVYVNKAESDGDTTTVPRTASSITVMEIAG
jgi:hypothetical protein